MQNLLIIEGSNLLNGETLNDFDTNTWKSLDIPARRKFLENSIKIYRDILKEKNRNFKSRVLTFLLDFDGRDTEVTVDAINALALVNALILTIPFGVFSFINGQFYIDYSNSYESCTDNQKNELDKPNDIRIYVQNNLAVCLYASLCGLLFASIYTIFKTDWKKLTTFQRLKERILLGCLFSCTVASIIGLLDVAFIFFFNYLSPDPCQYNRLAKDGNYIAAFFLSLTFSASVFFMY